MTSGRWFFEVSVKGVGDPLDNQIQSYYPVIGVCTKDWCFSEKSRPYGYIRSDATGGSFYFNAFHKDTKLASYNKKVERDEIFETFIKRYADQMTENDKLFAKKGGKVGVAIDIDKNQVWYGINGEWCPVGKWTELTNV
eukprot:UN33579